MKYAIWFLIVSLTLPAAATAAENQRSGSTAKQTVSVPIYKPPRVGAPAGRVGGGTRGTGDLPTLSVLAPDHIGLTTQEQPSLYWYLSQPTTHPIELSVIDPQSISPLLETQLQLHTRSGIQQVRLADYGVRLKPGMTYRWFVTLIPDPHSRSKDVVAGGLIERIEPSEALRAKLTQADQAEKPSIYAEAGLWYNAVAAISDLIDTASHAQRLRQQRAALLEQVGLQDVAAHDIQRGN